MATDEIRTKDLPRIATKADLVKGNYFLLDGNDTPRFPANFFVLPKQNSFAIVRNSKLWYNGNTRSGEWSYIDNIPVNNGDVVECSPGATDSVSVILYDSNKVKKDYYVFSSNAVRTFTVPSTVSLIAVPVKNSAASSAYIKINGFVVFDGSINGTWSEREEIDKRQGRNVYFVGKGTTFSATEWYGNFVTGNRYKIYLHNHGYADVMSDTSSYKFAVEAYNSSNTLIGSRLVVVYEGSTVARSYEFSIPENTAYIRIGGRIAEGETVVCEVVDVTRSEELVQELRGEVYGGKIYSKLTMPMSLINSSVSSGYPAYDSSTTRVCSEDIVFWPIPNGTYKVHAPGNMQVSTTCFTAAGASNGTTPWTGNGSTFTESNNSNYAYRISFRKSNDSAITADEVKAAIANGTLFVEVVGVRDVDYGNSLQLNAAASARKKLVEGNPLFKYLPSFVHISDIHGDITRLANARKVAELVNADALVNSGDSVMYESKNGCKFIGAFGDSSIPEIFCIGNHESYPTGVTGLFSKFISQLVTANGYEKSSGVAADDCYYFRDLTEKKIRVIVLNYYDNGVYDGSLGQTQLDWFVGALASTPEDYGVVVVLHSPEDKVVCPEEYAKFRQAVRVTTYQENGFYIGDRPVMNIIDGFISKVSGNESYTDNGTSVSVDYDFTSLNSGVEFICYMAGHRHEDWIGYYDDSVNTQLCLGITTGNAINSESGYYAFANQGDLGRNNGVGAPQDALNVYAIDRIAGKIKVVRIGADVTTSFAKRDYMEIPYK